MSTKHGIVALALAGPMLAMGAASFADEEGTASVEIITTTVAAGVAGQGGEGKLSLGAGCEYAFSVDGFGGGLTLGVTKMTATGMVKNLTRLEDFPGGYSATSASATLVEGQGVLSLKNQRNNVAMELKSVTSGVNLGAGAEGMTLKMKEPIPTPPQTYTIYFDYNSSKLNSEASALVAKIANDWKCRFRKLKLVGHTDLSGGNDYNMRLSEKRASAVVSELVNGGIDKLRLSHQGVGKSRPLMQTAEGKREAKNRAVIVSVE